MRNLTFSLAYDDPGMPRTVFYEALCQAIRRNRRYVPDPSAADILIPAEDVANETNWPRYGDPDSSFIRGRRDDEHFRRYIRSVVAVPRPLLVVNMDPFARMPKAFKDLLHVVVADISLSAEERRMNPRTISMPALPLAVGQGGGELRPVLTSFRGAASHPCRDGLFGLHDGQEVICEAVRRSNHCGLLDASLGKVDEPYVDLLARSSFGFVPRGDALFSYRLLEAMSFGAIPVILSDGWILPFDRLVNWPAAALHIPEDAAAAAVDRLRCVNPQQIESMRRQMRAVYVAVFSDLDRIVEALLREVELLAGVTAPQ